MDYAARLEQIKRLRREIDVICKFLVSSFDDDVRSAAERLRAEIDKRIAGAPH